MQMLDLKYMK